MTFFSAVRDRLMKLNRKLVILIVAILIVVAGFVAVKVEHHPKPSSATGSTKTYPSVAVDHPSAWSEVDITANERALGVFAKLERPKPDATLLVRSQAANNASNLDLSTTSADVINTLKSQILGFKLLSGSVTKVNNTGVIELTYQQSGTQGQNQMTIIPLSKQTLYAVYTVTGDTSISKIKADIDSLNKVFLAYGLSHP